MISDNSETIDMVAAAAAEDSRRKYWQIAGLVWTLAGTVFLTAGGYYGDPLVMALSAIGYFVVWGALSWLSGCGRLRIPCPVCGKKSESDEAIAFRRCQFCGCKLFAAPKAALAFPGQRALHFPRQWKFPFELVLFILTGAIFYGIAVRLWPLEDAGFSDGFTIRQTIFTAGALPCAAALLLLRRRLMLRRMPLCPVCNVRILPVWTNLSGNCNRCGATLLDIFEAEPGTPLPSPETVEQYCRTSESRAGVILFILLVLWFLMDFFDSAGAVMMLTFAGMLGAGIAVSRILDRCLRRKLNLGKCPSCGATVPWFVRPRRCPDCGRRVIATDSRI